MEFDSTIYTAIKMIQDAGYKVKKISKKELRFNAVDGSLITYYPKKQWATGSSITDCRGLHNLLMQI